MYKRLLSLALVSGSVLAASIAQAAVTHSTFPFSTGNGVWNVLISQQTNVPVAQTYRTFKITAAHKSFKPGDMAPVTDADQIRIQFFDGLKHPINPDCTGNVVGGVIVTGGAETYPTKTGGTGGPWTVSGGIRAQFRNSTAGGGPPYGNTTDLENNGNNAFRQTGGGEIRVDKTLTKCFTVQVTNFGGVFEDPSEPFRTYDHIALNLAPDAAPEASSLALLLPALVPLGIMIRRRARK